MNLEDLIKTLEQKVPGFSYTVFSHQPGAPVFLQWNHREPGLQKREAMMPRSIVAKDLKAGFEQVLARYESFEREDALKKQEAERAKRKPVVWVEGPSKGGVNREYQIPPESRPEDPPPMKPRRTTTERDDVPVPRRRALVLPE